MAASNTSLPQRMPLARAGMHQSVRSAGSCYNLACGETLSFPENTVCTTPGIANCRLDADFDCMGSMQNYARPSVKVVSR